MNLDEKIKESIKKMENMDFAIPFFNISIFNVHFSLYKIREMYLDFCETNPYRPDGEIPLIFLRMGHLEIVFESKKLYKYLYKKKYNEELDI